MTHVTQEGEVVGVGAKVAAAFVAAWPELRSVTKDSTNPHFRNRYVSLDALIDAVRPVLGKHGLAVTQTAALANNGGVLIVYSVLLHSSGESMTSAAFIPIVKPDAQGAGGALTYGRRYGLSALLCLNTDEDDDGEKAVENVRSAAARPFAGSGAGGAPGGRGGQSVSVSSTVGGVPTPPSLPAPRPKPVKHSRPDDYPDELRDRADDPPY